MGPNENSYPNLWELSGYVLSVELSMPIVLTPVDSLMNSTNSQMVMEDGMPVLTSTRREIFVVSINGQIVNPTSLRFRGGFI